MLMTPEGNPSPPTEVTMQTPDPEVPKEVKAVPRLVSDVEALSLLTQAESPPWRQVRAKQQPGSFVDLWMLLDPLLEAHWRNLEMEISITSLASGLLLSHRKRAPITGNSLTL